MSIYMYCPRCGSDAKSLLNLVSCITPQCRNYDPKWGSEWHKKNKPRYTHNSFFGIQHTFLGNFVSKKGTHYDLYHCRSFAEEDICMARCGNTEDDCYYVDNKETEVGIASQGPITLTDADIGSALQAALKRARGRRLVSKS